jgi:hypothetical protein
MTLESHAHHTEGVNLSLRKASQTEFSCRFQFKEASKSRKHLVLRLTLIVLHVKEFI